MFNYAGNFRLKQSRPTCIQREYDFAPSGPAVRHCLLSEKVFSGITLSNLKCGENFQRNYISNTISGYTEREIIRNSYVKIEFHTEKQNRLTKITHTQDSASVHWVFVRNIIKIV